MRVISRKTLKDFWERHADSEQALKAWCRRSLAQYKVPDRIACLPELPRNPTGKNMRRELKKLL